jgi:hypothetical protein
MASSGAVTTPNPCARAEAAGGDAIATSPERIVALNVKIVGCAAGRPVYEVLGARGALVPETRDTTGF